ncbi:MAG: hypothetical protein J5I53_11100 [Bradyrhizobiaceae bacterium]|nr:hypothetical protein [Bradyrhizobiaceae bacterium]
MRCLSVIKRVSLIVAHVLYSSVVVLLNTPLCYTQELTATRLHLSGSAWDGSTGTLIYTDEVIPFVLATSSTIPQPIRFLVGANASVRAVEIGGDGSTWIRGSLSVGELTGAAPGEMVRVGTLQPTGGKGVVVDMSGTTSTTGIHITNTGLTGGNDAAMLITSSANGNGTGIRIGGPTGSSRPTLGTGVDITGGTGIRYNALNAMDGTGVDVGGTTPPWRGVDATAAGPDHIGVLGRGNTIGTGVIGLSQSSSYTTVPSAPGVGVLGRSASNSNASSDTTCGVRGISLRGGTGGTRTIAIGVHGMAQSLASAHSGYSIGVMGTSESAPIGQGFPIGGLFAGHAQGLALAALGADVFLGSDDLYRPPQVPLSVFSQNSRSLVHLFSSQHSGIPALVNPMTVTIPTGTVAADLHINEVPIVRVITGVSGADVTGLDGGRTGRVVTIFNLGERMGIHNEGYDSAANNRILTPGGVVLQVPANGAVTLWYDGADQRWRVLSTSR